MPEPEPVAAIHQLVADLVEIDGLAEPRDQPLGFGAAVDIEGDDQRSGHGMSPMLRPVADCPMRRKGAGSRANGFLCRHTILRRS